MPVEISICAETKEAYNSEMADKFNIHSYTKWDWYGNSTNKTGEEIFADVTYGFSSLFKSGIQVRTGHQKWNFYQQNYLNANKKTELYKYNASVPSPFKAFRSYYSGVCFSFIPPDFVWKLNVRRIGITMKKTAFIRYF